MTGPAEKPPVCDYEGSDYRTRFWEQGGRAYEDLAERHALRALLPPAGTYLLDVGAGFGRLADEYDGYQHVVLLDYSRSLLREARQRLGDNPRFTYVAADWYRMPFTTGVFDTLVQVRTIHHAADVPALLRQLARIARPGADYVLEFANKRNLKAILRYALRRQTWSPFHPEPLEFVALNYDFHPRWMRRQLNAAGFRIRRQRAVSHFRLALLKRLFPAPLLAGADRMLQPTGRFLQLSPSVFVHCSAPPGDAFLTDNAIFACPHCGTTLGPPGPRRLPCSNRACGRVWERRQGVYDFKEPVAGTGDDGPAE